MVSCPQLVYKCWATQPCKKETRWHRSCRQLRPDTQVMQGLGMIMLLLAEFQTVLNFPLNQMD